MPRNVAPIQLDLSGGIGAGMLPFHIVRIGDSIQAAINAAALDGRDIWLFPGVHTIAATLTVPAASSIYIWGCGRDTIIQLPALVGFSPMFQLAAGVTEFELHDLFLDGNGWIDTVIETQGAVTHLQLDHMGVDIASFVGPNFNMIDQTGALGLTDVLVDYCDLRGGLDLRTSRANLRDSLLDAINYGHDFQANAVIYAARNRWQGGVGLGATVVVDGATAIFHDEGSDYTGDVALVIGDGEVSLRGCHMFAGTGNTISITGGQVSLEGCEVDNNAAETISHTGGTLQMSDCTVINTTRTCIHTDAPNAVRLGVHNCDIIATATLWGINVQDGQAEIVGNNFTQCGISVDVVATISANIIDSDVVIESIRVRANDVTITGNKIITCGHAGAIAIELDVNDDCVVVGNQLQGYTVNENAGAVGNIIANNRVGA